MTILEKGMNQDRHLSKSEIAKNKRSLYKSSFRELPEHTVYWDPMGSRLGKAVNLKKDFYEEDKEIIKQFNDLQRKGFSVSNSIETIRKNLDTGDWSLPTYYLPELTVVNPELTPMADLLPRETVRNESVYAQRETAQPSVSWGLETTNDTEGSYSYADATYDGTTYDVVGYGLASRIEDKMMLATNSLRSSESAVQRSHMNAMRQEEESQIIKGTDNDGSGFEGFSDKGTNYSSLSTGAGTDYLQAVRELVDEVEYQGGNRGSIVVITDFETHRFIRNDLDDFTRYNLDGTEELGFGFSTMEFDGIPIMKTHAISKNTSLSSNDPYMFAVDTSNVYMGMLQDTSVKPLGKVGPQEQFATDSYGTLVMEAPSHIQYYDAP